MPGVMIDVDMPGEMQTLYYNPLAALWHAFRGQQVARYLQYFDQVVAKSCLADTPRYIHQLLAFPNPGWDESKYAVEASLQAGRSPAICGWFSFRSRRASSLYVSCFRKYSARPLPEDTVFTSNIKSPRARDSW